MVKGIMLALFKSLLDYLLIKKVFVYIQKNGQGLADIGKSGFINNRGSNNWSHQQITGLSHHKALSGMKDYLMGV